MRTTKAVSEKITALTTGGGAFAVSGLLGVLDHFGVVIPLWLWLSFGALCVFLALVCFGLTLHMALMELRQKGLGLGPATVIALGLVVSAGGCLWGLATWLPSPKTKVPASEPGSLSPPVVAPKGHPEEPQPRSPIPPDPIPSPPPHLARSLTLDGLFPTFTQEEKEVVLTGITGRVANVGSDMLYWSVEKTRLYLNGVEVYNANSAEGSYLSPTRDSRLDSKIPTRITIPGQTSSLVIDISIHYDTVPKTGKRISYRKLEFPITWDGPTISVAAPRIISQRED